MAINYPEEQMHRIPYTRLTARQIDTKLAAVHSPHSTSPFSTALAGKSMQIVTDKGLTLDYRFTGTNALSVSENSGAPIGEQSGSAITREPMACA